MDRLSERENIMRRYLLGLVIVLWLAFLSSCGGGGSAPAASPGDPSISISPVSATLFCDQPQQFTATVTGLSNQGLIWTVNGVIGGSVATGTVMGNGLYTAPCGFTDGTTVTVKATSVTNSNLSASAAVTLKVLTLSISPKSVSLSPGQTQQFTVTANNGNPNTVTWFVNEIPGGDSTVGTISAAGLYTAPATPPASSVDVEGHSTVAPRVECHATVNLGGVTISGLAFKGPVTGASVKVYAVNTADASNGALLGSSTTDNAGQFQVGIPSTAGPVRVTVSGGTYVSESDSTVINNTCDCSAWLGSAAAKVSGLVVSPLSDLVNSLTIRNTKAGLSSPHDKAEATIQAFYGLASSPAVEFLVPKFSKSDLTADPNGFQAGLVLGALAMEAQTLCPAADRDDLYCALSSDVQDALLDGELFSSPVPFSCSSSGVLPSSAGTTDFLLALNNYVSNGAAITSAGITPRDVSSQVAAIDAGVAASPLTPPATGLTAGSSGAIAGMSFGGHQYVFIAARNAGVAVLDVTDPSHPTGKSWPYLYTNTFNSQNVGGVIPVVGVADHPQLLVFAYSSKHIALVNAQVLATGTPGVDDSKLVDFETNLPFAASSAVLFSGGSAFIAGGIPDAGRHGVWLASADGYAFFDTTTNSLGTIFPIESSPAQNLDEMLTENLGGDIAHNLLLAGNYLGVQLVDLFRNKSYYMDPTFFTNNVAPLQCVDCANEIVDANSIDSAYQVGIFTSEDTPNVGFVNLATINRTDATSPGTLSTFVPASGGFTMLTLGTNEPILSGSAVDSTTHQVLFMAGSFPDMVVGVLQDPSTVPASGTWSGLTDWSFYTLPLSPSLANYCPAGDPHAVGVIFNTAAGKSYGYLLDGCTNQAIQINMSAFLALPRAGTTGSPAHEPAGDPVTAGAIRTIPF